MLNFHGEAITNETAIQINELCMADPFFIYCVIHSEYEEKDLTTQEGVVNTVNYEISNDNAEMFLTWGEYLDKNLGSNK
jgi:ABC-type polysaccharide transport system permease subunit